MIILYPFESLQNYIDRMNKNRFRFNLLILKKIAFIPPLTSSAHTIDYSPVRVCDLLKGYIHSLKNSFTQALICLFLKNSCK